MATKDESLRGTGRTTKQMLEAPHGAVYVWVNGALHYPKDLAHRAGRKDLVIVAPAWMEGDRWRGIHAPDVILDHAASLNPRMWELFKIVRAQVKR